MMFSMAAVEIVEDEDLDFLLPFLYLVLFIFLPLPVEISIHYIYDYLQQFSLCFNFPKYVKLATAPQVTWSVDC